LVCAHCSCAVVGDLKQQGRYIYYRCSRRRSNCTEGYIREERLQELLANQLRPFLSLPPAVTESLVGTAEMLSEGAESRERQQQTSVERRLVEVERRRRALLDLRLAGRIDDDEFASKREELVLEETRAREDVTAFEMPQADPQEVVSWFVRTCRNISQIFEDGSDAEVRRLLAIVGSNYRYGAGKVDFEPVKPFDLAAQVHNRPNWRGAWSSETPYTALGHPEGILPRRMALPPSCQQSAQ